VDLESWQKNKEDIKLRARKVEEILKRVAEQTHPSSEVNPHTTLEQTAAALKKLDTDTAVIEIIDGETIDLFPGIKDQDINSVDRIKAVSAYIETRIKPILLKHTYDLGARSERAERVSEQAQQVSEQAQRVSEQAQQVSEQAQRVSEQALCPAAPSHAILPQRSCSERTLIPLPTIMVEYQMGPNSKAREVASAIIALFANNDIIVVNPTLKNKIATSNEGRYCNFISKYTTTYSANKAHAKYNFEVIENIFGSGIAPSTNAKRGHIADSFMQILGHIVHCDTTQ
jgi:hypothetical protein